ncbi:recombinase zinc beta ribbon domain-containing protein [Streptomyces angustmyceticus]|uniref:recombinase zinc beta ribbon domain-containing protein n=1 Tax=Streptomyces angustmyceticus TaxID=285578 RepID=UPI0036F3CD9A
MVAKMLRNPRYAGMVSYLGKHRLQAVTAGDGWSLVLFDDEGHPLLGSWEPIVTPKLWSQVQFEWQRRRQKAGIKPGESGHAPANKYFLSGILRCSKCDRGLVGHRYRRKSGKLVHNYVCPSSERGGCGGIAISTPTADAAVEEAMNYFLRKQLQASKIGLNLDSPGGTARPAERQRQARRGMRARRSLAVGRYPDLWKTPAGVLLRPAGKRLGSQNGQYLCFRAEVGAAKQEGGPRRRSATPRTVAAPGRRSPGSPRSTALGSSGLPRTSPMARASWWRSGTFRPCSGSPCAPRPPWRRQPSLPSGYGRWWRSRAAPAPALPRWPWGSRMFRLVGCTPSRVGCCMGSVGRQTSDSRPSAFLAGQLNMPVARDHEAVPTLPYVCSAVLTCAAQSHSDFSATGGDRWFLHAVSARSADHPGTDGRGRDRRAPRR